MSALITEVSRATSAVDDDDAEADTKSPRRASFASERSGDGAAPPADGDDSGTEVGALRFLAAAAAAAAGAGMFITKRYSHLVLREMSELVLSKVESS